MAAVGETSGPVVPDLLVHAATRYPQKTCVIVEQRSMSFAEVSDRASRLAAHLRSVGLVPGDRVALLAQNDAEYIEVRAGSQRAGVTLVPLNYRLSAAELQSILVDCEPRILIVGPDCAETAAHLVGCDQLHLGPLGSYEAALRSSEPGNLPMLLEAARAGVISYTSGTTGEPKGVVLSNWSLHATMLACGFEIGASSHGTYIASSPLFHLGSQVGFAFTYLGGTHVQLRKFDAEAFVSSVSEHAVTHAQLVPTMVRDVLRIAADRPAQLRRILYGAAPMQPALARQALESWGCELVNGYGSTEIMMVSSLTPAEHDADRPELLASVGRGAVGSLLRVVDDGGTDVKVGEIGEVIAAGPTAMSGYWRRPELSGDVIREGWVHTGDLGFRDDDGYLFLVDRKADKIVTGGENVYPSEVEQVIALLPSVEEVAVVGISDARWGEMVTAVVVPRSGETLTAEQVLIHTRRHLAGFKLPKRIVLAESLPRNPTGKLLRRDLRTALAPSEDQTAGRPSWGI